MYSVYLISHGEHGSNASWDTASPRSERFAASLKKSISPSCYAKYERCRAAHANMMDNMAWVVGAVLAGNMIKLDATYMNSMMLLYLSSRAVYIVCYIQIERQGLSRLRSMVYTVGATLLFFIYVKAAGVLASGAAY